MSPAPSPSRPVATGHTDPSHLAPAAPVARRARAGALRAFRLRPQLRDRLRAGVRATPVPAAGA